MFFELYLKVKNKSIIFLDRRLTKNPLYLIEAEIISYCDILLISKNHMLNLIESFHVYLHIQYDEQNQLRVTLSIPRYFSRVEKYPDHFLGMSMYLRCFMLW